MIKEVRLPEVGENIESGEIVKVLVAVGDEIQRGQPVALADNTGRSTDPHLHYQVQANNADWGQSIQIRFQTDRDTCDIPQTGDSRESNNFNPNFP